MNWSYAANPDLNISQPWHEDSWPPLEWYNIPDAALGRMVELWRFDNFEANEVLIGKMTEEQLMLWAVENMIGQVCNGGFSQALFNSYGELAEEAVIGLHKFGFTRHAEIFEEAWTLFGIRPVPRDRNARIEQLEALADIDEGDSESSSVIEHASIVLQGTHTRWEALEDELYELLDAKTHGDGYNAAFYRPLAEWICNHKSRFFIT